MAQSADTPNGASLARGARISAGMQLARAEGTRLGRPVTTKEPEIAELILAGWPRARVCAEVRCGHAVYERVKRLLTEGRTAEHRAQISSGAC